MKKRAGTCSVMMNNFITKELLHKEVHNWSNYLGALLATEMILNNNIKIIGFYGDRP